MAAPKKVIPEEFWDQYHSSWTEVAKVSGLHADDLRQVAEIAGVEFIEHLLKSGDYEVSPEGLIRIPSCWDASKAEAWLKAVKENVEAWRAGQAREGLN